MASNEAPPEHISKRAIANYSHGDIWGPREKSMASPWSQQNRDGPVILRLAENSLMHEEVAQYIEERISVSPTRHLTYSTGSRGSLQLRQRIADFLTNDFHARYEVTTDQLLITSGLTGALDAISWAVCDPSEAILVPRPFYNGFNHDFHNRSGVVIRGVSYTHIEGYKGLDDVFDAEVNTRALETALEEAKQEGIVVRALVITNPHNPLGRCYPPNTLKAFAGFCGKHGLHYISDEIYAKSVFRESPDMAPFISVLSLDLDGLVHPKYVHVLYGASKDFCANGLRLGVLQSRNEVLLAAVSSVSMFAWVPHVVQDIWAGMLDDKTWLKSFMDVNQTRMQSNYSTAITFLADHGIKCLPINAGLVLWVDLRQLHARWAKASTLINGARPALVNDFEVRLIDLCASNGVYVAPGHIYTSEEVGWFRLAFTVEADALVEGLTRFVKSLTEFERDIDVDGLTSAFTVSLQDVETPR